MGLKINVCCLLEIIRLCVCLMQAKCFVMALWGSLLCVCVCVCVFKFKLRARRHIYEGCVNGVCGLSECFCAFILKAANNFRMHKFKLFLQFIVMKKLHAQLKIISLITVQDKGLQFNSKKKKLENNRLRS